MKSFVRLPLVKRDQWILDKCKQKEVIHIGCANSPKTRQKAEKNSLLHQNLPSVCQSLIGLDIDEDALEILRKEYNIQNIRYGDAENLHDSLSDEKFNTILAPDVVEHLNNPGLFWEGARKCLEGVDNGQLIVTVPMAFSLKRFASLLLCHNEHPNYDHVAYYSPACMMQSAKRYGFSMCESVAFLWRNPTFVNRISNFCTSAVIHFSRNAYFTDGLGCVFELK